MNVRSTHEKSVRRYVIAITLFIAVVALILAVFFVSLFTNVEHVVDRELSEMMARQSSHIDSSFSIRFQNLESAADFLGKQADIHGKTALQYIQTMSKNSSMWRVAIYDADGNAVFDNGEAFEGGDLEHIRLALRGERSFGDQSDSPSGGRGFSLSVPIRRGDEIIGALSASFGSSELDGLLFSDGYKGLSIQFIADRNGRVVYPDALPNAFGLKISKNIYGQLQQSSFPGGESAEELIAKFERGESGMAEYRQSDGFRAFLLYAPIADSNLILMHAIPHDAAYGEFDFIERSVIIVGLALLICVALLVIFLVYSSTHSQRNLLHVAQTDPLTGLYNRQYTQEAIELWLTSEARTGIQAMLFMDIDYFKEINDTYGHNAGDDALRFVSRALRQEFRSSDIIGRFGGDEFVIFMRNVPIKHIVRMHVDSLRARLKDAEVPGIDRGMLHCSIGIAYAPEHGNTYRELNLCADKALYQTKERGRDGYTEYTDGRKEEQSNGDA